MLFSARDRRKQKKNKRAKTAFVQSGIRLKEKPEVVTFARAAPTTDVLGALFGNGMSTGSYKPLDPADGTPTSLTDMCFADGGQAQKLVALLRLLRTENKVAIKKRVKASWRAPILIRGPSGCGKTLLARLAAEFAEFTTVSNVSGALDSIGRSGTTEDKRRVLKSLLVPPCGGVLNKVAIIDDFDALTSLEQSMVMAMLNSAKLVNTTPFIVIVTDPVDTTCVRSDVWRKLRDMCAKTTIYMNKRTDGEVHVVLTETLDKAAWCAPLMRLNKLSKDKAVLLAARTCGHNLNIALQTLHLFVLDVLRRSKKGFGTPSIADASYDMFAQVDKMLFTYDDTVIDSHADVFILAEALMNAMKNVPSVAPTLPLPPPPPPSLPPPSRGMHAPALDFDVPSLDAIDDELTPMKEIVYHSAHLELPVPPPPPPEDPLTAMVNMMEALSDADTGVFGAAMDMGVFVASLRTQRAVNALYPVRPPKKRLGNVFPFDYVKLQRMARSGRQAAPAEFGTERCMAKLPRGVHWDMDGELMPQVQLLTMPPHGMQPWDAMYALLSSVGLKERFIHEHTRRL